MLPARKITRVPASPDMTSFGLSSPANTGPFSSATDHSTASSPSPVTVCALPKVVPAPGSFVSMRRNLSSMFPMGETSAPAPLSLSMR